MCGGTFCRKPLLLWGPILCRPDWSVWILHEPDRSWTSPLHLATGSDWEACHMGCWRRPDHHCHWRLPVVSSLSLSVSVSVSLSLSLCVVLQLSHLRTLMLRRRPLTKPSVHYQHLSKLLPFLGSIPNCYVIPICRGILDWTCMYLRFYLFSLSLSFLSILFVSLSRSSFTQPTLSRMVPFCEPGPAQGFFLLKGTFSLSLCLPGVPALGFFLCKAPRDNLL